MPELTVEALNFNGEFEYDLPSGTATGTNGVMVKYRDMVLTAMRVSINQSNTTLQAEGQVRLVREGQTWLGQQVIYDYKNRFLLATNFRSGQAPLFVSGGSVTSQLSNNTYVAYGAYLTTDDYSEPFQRIRTRKLIIVPNGYVEAHSATLYIGKVPVFYFPYYRRPLGKHVNYWDFTPGYRSTFGPFLYSTYHWYWNDKLDGAMHLDYRVNRGPAVGPDLNMHLGRLGEGQLNYYYTRDTDAGRTPLPGNREIGTDRERFSYTHSLTIDSNTTARLVARYQSDQQMIHDFFEGEYQENVQPSSFLEVEHRWSNWSLNGLGMTRLNRFNDTVERLPDIKLTGFRQQLGESPFYYDSESSFGWYRRLFSYDTLGKYSASRGDTYHQITLPQNYFGWLNVSPRVGGRFTAYSAADGPGATTTDQSRGVFNTGAELSTKLSRVWPAAQNSLLDVKGIRHILTPSINYVYVPTPSARPSELPQFDYEIPSYRMLPIEYPDYNSIDGVDSQNVFRLGLRNKIQTKREGQVENLINWMLASDCRLRPRGQQSSFGDLYSQLDFSPRSWITLSQETRFDTQNSKLRELDHRLTLTPDEVWSFAVGNRFMCRDPFYGITDRQNLYYTQFYYRLNENWAFRTSHHFEAHLGKMQEQYYTVYRDLRSWTAALTLRMRSNVGGKDEVTVAVTFSLKAFPRFRADYEQPNRLLGD
ncbi:MAG: LPS assembly protein LptD [Verrucomicrobiota bacterium]